MRETERKRNNFKKWVNDVKRARREQTYETQVMTMVAVKIKNKIKQTNNIVT